MDPYIIWIYYGCKPLRVQWHKWCFHLGKVYITRGIHKLFKLKHGCLSIYFLLVSDITIIIHRPRPTINHLLFQNQNYIWSTLLKAATHNHLLAQHPEVQFSFFTGEVKEKGSE